MRARDARTLLDVASRIPAGAGLSGLAAGALLFGLAAGAGLFRLAAGAACLPAWEPGPLGWILAGAGALLFGLAAGAACLPAWEPGPPGLSIIKGRNHFNTKSRQGSPAAFCARVFHHCLFALMYSLMAFWKIALGVVPVDLHISRNSSASSRRTFTPKTV